MSSQLESGERLSDVKADETVEELVDRKRIQQIFTRRDRLYDILQQAPAKQLESNRVTDSAVRYLFDQALRGLVIDLRPLMQAAAAGDGAGTDGDYWNGRGPHHDEDDDLRVTATFEPPQEVIQARALRYRSPPNHETWEGEPSGVTVTGYGASALFVVEPPVSLTWEYEKRQRHGGRSLQQVTESFTLPRSYLREVFNICNDFLQAVDFDASIGGGEIVEHADPI